MIYCIFSPFFDPRSPKKHRNNKTKETQTIHAQSLLSNESCNLRYVDYHDQEIIVRSYYYTQSDFFLNVHTCISEKR